MATKEQPAAAKTGGKKKGGLGFILTMVAFGAAAPFIMPTLTLLLAGLAPTFVAFLTDRDRDNSSAVAVGAMNCAGVTPFIIDLWSKGQTMDHVFAILREPSSWLIMLGAAGIGQLIVFIVPQLMASMTVARGETKLKIMKQNLEQLKTTWGPDVATTKPLDRVAKGE